jgi:nickel/cobalt exporter
MNDFTALIQQGTTSAWLFIPSAILLGILHGLEPGHSKTMMAAFIIAVRGTIRQAVLLGLSATLSHTAVVWVVALTGLYFGSHWNTETSEPFFQLVSAILMISVAVWMMFRTWRFTHQHHTHDHDHHHDESKIIDTGHGVLRLETFENGVPPCFRIHAESSGALNGISNTHLLLETERADGTRQTFRFKQKGKFFESTEAIPEPHEFVARLKISHGHHSHDFDIEFTEHGHKHALPDLEGLDVATAGYQDPHELAHANDIRHRFANQHVTTGQIVIFGLTGGLIPCPAAITVLLLCLQLKQASLGAALVLCFSIGLALTMVTSGVLAALSVKHVSKRWGGFGSLAQHAPYISGVLITLVGLYIGYHGLVALY